ncbi:MAG: hypothetical protein KGH64_02925 [Candidatus Micrarchaeota archaeon]|nr:hypothetical protein [Candidatus Micrarchaeota archaeon]
MASKKWVVVVGQPKMEWFRLYNCEPNLSNVGMPVHKRKLSSVGKPVEYESFTTKKAALERAAQLTDLIKSWNFEVKKMEK